MGETWLVLILAEVVASTNSSRCKVTIRVWDRHMDPTDLGWDHQFLDKYLKVRQVVFNI